MRRFLFVLEQALGHVTHTQRLERALAGYEGVESEVLRIQPQPGAWQKRLPALRSWSFQASWAARTALRRQLGRGSIDALFIYTQVAALLAGNAMRRVPTVLSLDATPRNFDTVGRGYGHRNSAPWLEWGKQSINRMAFGQAAAFAVFSPWVAGSLVSDYGVPAEKIHVIRPGIDLERYRPPSRNGAGPVRVLFVGGDFRRKGGDQLLRAVDKIGDGVELDVVTSTDLGGGAARPWLRVHRGLKADSAELVDLYRRADIFALPTQADCFPHSVVEALASGLPIVATRIGGIPDMVCDEDNGLMVPAGDEEALRVALGRLIAEPAARRSMGERSRQKALLHYDTRKTTGAIVELMTEVAVGGRGSRR